MAEPTELVKAAGKIVEKIPDIYDDGAKPSVKEVGKLASLVPRTINALLSPLWSYVIHKEYSLKETEKILQKKLENCSSEEINQPEPYVGVPVLQALSYSIDNIELRNRYANLLAKSMHTATKEQVHPSFVEVLKQLSPQDAQIFDEIVKNNVRPVIHISAMNDDGGFISLCDNLTWIDTFPQKTIAVSISNLMRLGLIESNYSKGAYVDKHAYDKVIKTQNYQIALKEANEFIESISGFEINTYHQLIAVTDYGKSFHEIVCIDTFG